MQQKTRTSKLIALIVISLLIVGASIWWFVRPTNSEEEATTQNIQSTEYSDRNTPAAYDPNRDASGNLVTSNDVDKMRQKLLDEGLPADQWAPSDIKKIIVKSSMQGISPINYARENFHGK